MGSLKHELARKVMTADAELYLAACRAFAAHDLVSGAANLANAVRDNEPLLRALARYYLEHCVAPDMIGARLSSVEEGLQVGAYGHSTIALPHGSVEGEAGQQPRAGPVIDPLPASPSPLESGGAVSPTPSGQLRGAPPLSPRRPIHAGAGHVACADSHSISARPRVKPNPPRGLRAMAAANVSLFDTFKVRDGRAIGDLTVFEARRIAATNEREARILRSVCDHVAGHVEPGTPLREAVKVKVLERAVAQNMEASDAA